MSDKTMMCPRCGYRGENEGFCRHDDAASSVTRSLAVVVVAAELMDKLAEKARTGSVTSGYADAMLHFLVSLDAISSGDGLQLLADAHATAHALGATIEVVGPTPANTQVH